jgi:pimeloyl-ACP methyl ester carboxylesterase
VPLAMRTGPGLHRRGVRARSGARGFPDRAGGALAIRPRSFEHGCYELAHGNADVMKAQAPRYGEIALPVSILYGRQDALLDPELHGGKTASDVQNGKVDYLDGGHMLPVTHVDATEAWLRGL